MFCVFLRSIRLYNLAVLLVNLAFARVAPISEAGGNSNILLSTAAVAATSDGESGILLSAATGFDGEDGEIFIMPVRFHGSTPRHEKQPQHGQKSGDGIFHILPFPFPFLSPFSVLDGDDEEMNILPFPFPFPFPISAEDSEDEDGEMNILPSTAEDKSDGMSTVPAPAKCPIPCPKNFAQICAGPEDSDDLADRQTFNNSCLLDNFNCGKERGKLQIMSCFYSIFYRRFWSTGIF